MQLLALYNECVQRPLSNLQATSGCANACFTKACAHQSARRLTLCAAQMQNHQDQRGCPKGEATPWVRTSDPSQLISTVQGSNHVLLNEHAYFSSCLTWQAFLCQLSHSKNLDAKSKEFVLRRGMPGRKHQRAISFNVVLCCCIIGRISLSFVLFWGVEPHTSSSVCAISSHVCYCSKHWVQYPGC